MAKMKLYDVHTKSEHVVGSMKHRVITRIVVKNSYKRI